MEVAGVGVGAGAGVGADLAAAEAPAAAPEAPRAEAAAAEAEGPAGEPAAAGTAEAGAFMQAILAPPLLPVSEARCVWAAGGLGVHMNVMMDALVE